MSARSGRGAGLSIVGNPTTGSGRWTKQGGDQLPVSAPPRFAGPNGLPYPEPVRFALRSPRLSPVAYRRVTLVALWSLVFIVVTGAAVRLSGSGLGCSDWPTCENNRVVAPFEYHAMVEFVNRSITGLVSIAVILAVLGSLGRVPRRRDL